MKTPLTAVTTRQIRHYIQTIPVGQPFTQADFTGYGTRMSIDQALCRMVKAGLIERVTRGVFVRPEVSPYVGKVMPEPFKVAQSLTKSTGAIVQINGAEAAQRLGLTTQVPVKSIFHTSGPTRHIRMGNMEVTLKHVSPRKLALAGQPAGLALAALWYLGKKGVSTSTLAKLQNKLPTSEFEALKSAKNVMPAWMADVFYRYERMTAHA